MAEEITQEIKWVNDPSHPSHPLKQLYKNTQFRCDICRTQTRGARLNCNRCDFNLHEGCAALPTTLSGDFFAHRRHPLHLKTAKPGLFASRKCLLCGHSIKGASYECRECRHVSIHPLCTRLPERVPIGHALHPLHPLRLEPPPGSEDEDPCVCDACGKWPIANWKYSCGACNVHFHIECLDKGVDAVNARRAAMDVAREYPGGISWPFNY